MRTQLVTQPPALTEVMPAAAGFAAWMASPDWMARENCTTTLLMGWLPGWVTSNSGKV